ncbi:hypothetical protein L1D15_21685, partial [Vibrio sp. Isolate25]|uniref:hypothetical protein n=1 Tax=Vibrio sp. Isolate25 TaxID=2908535 RepID=UPI001EFDA27B
AYDAADPQTPIDVTSDPSATFTVDGTYITAFDPATGVATAGNTISDSTGTGWIEATYGGHTVRVAAHVWGSAPPNNCQTNGNNYVVLSNGTAVACPLTVIQADQMGVPYEASANDPSGVSRAAVSTLTGLVDYCSALTFGGLDWGARVSVRSDVEQFVVDANAGFVDTTGWPHDDADNRWRVCDNAAGDICHYNHLFSAEIDRISSKQGAYFYTAVHAHGVYHATPDGFRGVYNNGATISSPPMCVADLP